MSWSCGLQFRVRTGPERGMTYPIDAPVLKIGRARMPGDRQVGWIRLLDDSVSRLHCELFWQEDRKSFRLLHRSTTNSTYLNGEAVEDAELFDGDLLEIGAITLELQKADLRWSVADDKAVTDWPQRPHEATSIPAEPLAPAMMTPIPGATVPAVSSAGGMKLSIGPKEPFCLVSAQGETYSLSERKIRFGAAVNPEDALEEVAEGEGEEKKLKKKPHFDAHYVLEGLDFSYYNFILRYDELSLGYKAARLGPNAQEISISRRQGGLTWHSSFPEGVEVDLLPGDHLLIGNLEFTYQRGQG